MRQITAADVADIALGSSLLGAGGGGDPYTGSLVALGAIKEFGPVQLLDVDEVPDEWFVAPICGVGAPSVLAEKGLNGGEFQTLIDAIEQVHGRKLDAFLLSEVGGLNSVVPIAAAGRAGIPLIDADGMGRAFPGIQQDTFSLNGVPTSPMAFADEKGNVAVLNTVDNDWMETIGRAVTSAVGGQVLTLGSCMSGAKMKGSVVRGSLTKAQQVGRIIRTAKELAQAAQAEGDVNATPEQAFLRETGAVKLIAAKIVDVRREVRGAFNFGTIALEGIREDKGRSAQVDFQNENLVARVDGKLAAMVPDLVCLVDAETFIPVTTDALKYGKRVLVVGLPCDPVWRTPGGIALAGPRWFGYDVDYVPLEELSSRGADA